MMSMTVATWNLKGSKGVDVEAVAAHLTAVGADVVALQEVQRHQARALAAALGARSVSWGFKHWPIRTWPEGMAVIGVTVPVHVRTHALSDRWRPWSWRRRIYQLATLAPVVSSAPSGSSGSSAGAGSGGVVTAIALANVHLSTKRAAERRAAEVATVLSAVTGGRGLPIVTGDFNDRPGSALFERFTAVGLRDAWDDVAPDLDEKAKATNWRGWVTGTDEPPVQRLDYLMVPAGLSVTSVAVPRPGDDGFALFSRLSDHVPVAATLDLAVADGGADGGSAADGGDVTADGAPPPA
jgi:endonuclease/exonuclease/phosphatase family metal-dependent hydrolase